PDLPANSDGGLKRAGGTGGRRAAVHGAPGRAHRRSDTDADQAPQSVSTRHCRHFCSTLIIWAVVAGGQPLLDARRSSRSPTAAAAAQRCRIGPLLCLIVRSSARAPASNGGIP